MQNKTVILILVILFILGVIVYQRRIKNPAGTTPPPPVSGMPPSSQTYNAGLTIIDLPYTTVKGKSETITTAVWYPTQQEPKQFTYHVNKDFTSMVALNASTAPGGPFPLVLFAHGGFSSGYASAYFMEYLAKNGFIVAAPDYVDTKPPEYIEPIAFSTIKKGKADPTLQVLRAARTWLDDMNADRQFFLSYLEEHRLNHTSFVIDQMLKLNTDSSSLFYQKINRDKIGAMGHSEGGLTILGKIGAHSNNAYKDGRIKVALLFSSPVHPFENNLASIQIPTMAMAGDTDKESVGVDAPRKLLYERASVPKYYLVVKNATHFTFSNQEYQGLPLYQTVEQNPQTNVISRYGLAFFQKYLKNDPSADTQLATTDPNLVYYSKEEKPGDIFEQGTEPKNTEGSPGGIRDAIRDTILKRIQERRKSR